MSGQEIGHRIPRLNLLLNTDEPITVTFTRKDGTPYPPGAVLTLQVGGVDWPAVVSGLTATVRATAEQVNATVGTDRFRVLYAEGDQTSIAVKGAVSRDA